MKKVAYGESIERPKHSSAMEAFLLSGGAYRRLCDQAAGHWQGPSPRPPFHCALATMKMYRSVPLPVLVTSCSVCGGP